MGNVKCEVQCEHCKEWFPSAIYLGSEQAFSSTITEGNLQNCPCCGKMTGCNKDNMRFDGRDDEGEVTTIEGKKTW